jgi:hypothetical protein
MRELQVVDDQQFDEVSTNYKWLEGKRGGTNGHVRPPHFYWFTLEDLIHADSHRKHRPWMAWRASFKMDLQVQSARGCLGHMFWVNCHAYMLQSSEQPLMA